MPGGEQRQGNLVGAVRQEDLAVREAETLDVVQERVLLDVRDAVLLAVVLPEHEARDGPVMREVDEPLIEGGVLLEVREVAREARGRDLRLEGGEFRFVDGQPCSLSAGEARVGHDVAPLVVAVNRVLRRQPRQDAEGIDGHGGIRRVELVQEGEEFLDFLGRGLFLAGRQQAAVEQLVDGEEDGVSLACLYFLEQPAAHALRVAGLRVVVLQLVWRRHDLRAADASRIDDELAAGRAAVERHEHDMVLRRFLRRDGRAGRVVQGSQIPEPEREERHEHENQERTPLSISFQRDALTFIPNF